MTKRIFLLFCLIAGLGWTTLYAQRPLGLKPPIKWGDIPREHLAMDHYAPDTNATVVILAGEEASNQENT